MRFVADSKIAAALSLEYLKNGLFYQTLAAEFCGNHFAKQLASLNHPLSRGHLSNKHLPHQISNRA